MQLLDVGGVSVHGIEIPKHGVALDIENNTASGDLLAGGGGPIGQWWTYCNVVPSVFHKSAISLVNPGKTSWLR